MPTLRQLTLTTLLTVLVSTAVFGAAVPASAHDDLADSSPSSGEQLSDPPAEITLTYTDDLLAMGAAVIVVDQNGRDWVDGDTTLNGTTLTVPLAPDMPVAGYEIRWRVVSSDGHPISGVVPFTVGDAAPLERTSSATPSVPAAAAVPESPALPEWARVALIAVGGAVVALLLLIGIRILRRRTPARTSPEASSPADRNLS